MEVRKLLRLYFMQLLIEIREEMIRHSSTIQLLLLLLICTLIANLYNQQDSSFHVALFLLVFEKMQGCFEHKLHEYEFRVIIISILLSICVVAVSGSSCGVLIDTGIKIL